MHETVVKAAAQSSARCAVLKEARIPVYAMEAKYDNLCNM